MKRNFRKTTYEDAVAHAEELIATMRADSAFAELEEQAAGMGITFAFSLRHTQVDEMMGAYNPFREPTGRIPSGYALEIWVDLVRDGWVLCAADDAEEPTQYSLSLQVVSHPGGLISAMVPVLFHEYDAVLEDNQPFAILGEYLDACAEHGFAASPFREDALCPTEPVGDGVCHFSTADLAEGNYTELSPHPYAGSFGGADSLFLSEHAFLPYRLLLIGLIGLPACRGEATELSQEDAARFCDLLTDDLPDAVAAECNVSDVLSACSVTAFAPPPNAERLLNTVMFRSKRDYSEEDFLAETGKMAAWIKKHLAAGDPLTVIW